MNNSPPLTNSVPKYNECSFSNAKYNLIMNGFYDYYRIAYSELKND
jgi:hypothetical protein